MIAAAHPDQERRLAALRRYGILDTDRESDFDEVVALVSKLCDAPIAVVNFIDAERQWFKAEVGLGVRSTPLDTSICSHVILEKEFVEIEDTQLDVRMRDNPLCSGSPALRFYAGAVLQTDDGLPLGTLCVLDHEPRRLTSLQREAVEVLARQVMRQLDLRLALRQQEILRREIDHRVKNSLASVAAIVTLQANRTDSEQVKEALTNVQNRLVALVSLHEHLHDASDAESVKLEAFIPRAVEMMRPLVPEGVKVAAAVAPAGTTPEKASLIGIIVNEFVANSAKHAFTGNSRGTIEIRGTREGADYRVECIDNGSGSPEQIVSQDRQPGLGVRIIGASAASLGATARWSPASPGLRLSLQFSL